MIIALIVAGVLALAFLVLVFEMLRQLFWFAARLAIGGIVASVVAVTAVALAPNAAWTAAPLAFVAFIATFRASRRWGAVKIGRDPSDRGQSCGNRKATLPVTLGPHASLLDPSLREALWATEQALDRAARDALGQPAAEWLSFWRHRVQDLIAAAQDVWEDAAPREKSDTAHALAVAMDDVIAEADRRLETVRNARRDLFAARANHAATRVRDG